ncbi:unnamed protein product [Auanema sp. JU1783]|nr:unnamed protein product [Auanema sp. JU1783]
MTCGTLRRSSTLNDTNLLPNYKKFELKYDLNDNRVADEEKLEKIVEERCFAWSWPFCTEGLAHGAYTREKFVVCLPFNKGGTGDKNGTTKRFENIAGSNYSWSLGLSRDAKLGSTCFWRLEIEVHRHLNSIVLIASRDISRYNENTKRLKRVRKVYSLPDIYDVTTTTTTMYDWAIVIEAKRRHVYRPLLRRSDTLN